MRRWEPAVEAAVGTSQLREDQRLCAYKAPGDPPFARASSSSHPACVSRLTSLVQSTHSPGGQATLFSMASTCYPPITDSYPYGSIFELGMQSSKPPASPGARPLGFATSFNLGRGHSPTESELNVKIRPFFLI
jgi:hypothetical protein